MKNLNQYLLEKLSLDDENIGAFSFEIDIDSASDAKELLRGIEEVYGKTGIHIEDGKYSNVTFKGDAFEDFLKVCGLISVAWNINGTDSIMQYNGDEEDDCDLAFYVPGYGDEIEANINEIEKYAKLWIKWFENNEFENSY